ncbi:hypothetical protein DMN91_010908 [Ooceraea biroi]|uniref:Gustatory receptor n=1 Tax=Ooceraea biroi TaxID=2015173 RepID=A0A3L8D8J7_OOCBI|nr:hypothetical protein DMN91_010908 [Ooceraea biroi]
MKYIYDIILNNSFQLIYFSLRSWYTIVCWLIMDGIFAHCVNDIYLRLRELNKIAIQYSKEKLSVSSVDFTTNSNAFNKHNDVVVIGIRLIQHIHHGLYVLSTKFRKMAIILHDAFLEHRLLRAEVIHFSLQLVHEDLTFSAFGLYDINIPHFCSVSKMFFYLFYNNIESFARLCLSCLKLDSQFSNFVFFSIVLGCATFVLIYATNRNQ